MDRTQRIVGLLEFTKMATNPVKITDTTFRDGHQSLIATRLRMEDMEPVASQMDKIGFHSMEVWGGATFDATTRFLAEDPWERLRRFRELIPNTPLSMLLRGQSLVGYRNYADDVVCEFVKRSAENGIDIFRVFDALNDEWNLTCAAESVKSSGKHLQMAICYSVTESGRMGGPIYNVEYFIKKAKQFESMGADSLCIKDMAGLLAPYDAFDLISELKRQVSVPLQLHTHYTSGMGSMTALKAIEAGVDIVDAALAPLALRTSQPAVEPLVVSLAGGDRDTGIDLNRLLEVGDYFESILPKYSQHMASPRFAVIDAKVLSHQIPGGMASNLNSQLREANAIDKLNEVLEEIPQTRKDLGYPPLVTPISQMVGSQAVSNVLVGRYNMISDQVKEYVYGMYGRAPSKVNPEVISAALSGYEKGSNPISERPADHIKPEIETAKAAVSEITDDMDDVLIYALYPTTGMKFLRIKHGLDPVPEEMKADLADKPNNLSTLTDLARPEKSASVRAFNVFIDDSYFKVEVDPTDGSSFTTTGVSSNEKSSRNNTSPEKSELFPGNGTLSSPMPGILLHYIVEVGQRVEVGDPIAVLEAMKMENTLPSPIGGTVESLNVEAGATVVKGDVLATISP